MGCCGSSDAAADKPGSRYASSQDEKPLKPSSSPSAVAANKHERPDQRSAARQQQQISSSRHAKGQMIHKCCDYLPGMSGEFVCYAHCPQRLDENATVWGGEEVVVQCLPMTEQQTRPAAQQAIDALKKNGVAIPSGASSSSPTATDNSSNALKRVYSAASNLCRAAQHAGAIKVVYMDDHDDDADDKNKKKSDVDDGENNKNNNNNNDNNGEYYDDIVLRIDESRSSFGFRVVTLEKKGPDSVASKTSDPIVRDRASGRMVADEGAVFVKRDWPAEVVEGSDRNDVESLDVAPIASQWMVFV